MTKIIEPDKQTNIFRRPSSEYGIWSWITTVDHKKIGIMYGYAAFFFLLIGGLEALVLRIQLAQPDNNFLSAAEYNAMFTMHGTTMLLVSGFGFLEDFSYIQHSYLEQQEHLKEDT